MTAPFIPYLPEHLGAEPAGTAAALITALIGAAPATLDQINELAAAIGNDPNFAVTLAAALAGKMSETDARVSETRTQLIPSAGSAGAQTLNLNLGRAFSILCTTNNPTSLSIVIENCPAGVVDVSISLWIICGASVPTITWPTGAVSVASTASKSNRRILETLDGVNWMLSDAGAF